MSLRFAILTALTERSATGLSLARRFDRSIGYFWRASHQQIYRELDRLSASGLIQEEPATGTTGRGQPRQFRITADGRRLLRGWIQEDDEPSPDRVSVVVRVRAAAATGDAQAVRSAVRYHLERRLETLETYKDIEQRDFTPGDGGFDVAHELQHLVLRSGLLVEQAWIDWCHEVLEVLDRASARPE